MIIFSATFKLTSACGHLLQAYMERVLSHEQFKATPSADLRQFQGRIISTELLPLTLFCHRDMRCVPSRTI